MVNQYIPVFEDWIEVTKELNDQEKGRLIDAMVLYLRSENWQERIKGNERYLFPAFQRMIDRNNDISEARKAAGRKGGEQKKINSEKNKQTLANGSKTLQNIANATEEKEKEKNKKEILNNTNITKHKHGKFGHVLLTDDELKKLQERFTDWQAKIDNLDEGIELKGYKYKNHYLAIIKWAEKDTPSRNAPARETEQRRAPTQADVTYMQGVLSKIKGGD